ncbi:MAG: serine--tRNA ligase [Candidatus Omnitrophica bacterium]|nr:serine--tRNA ligase [Candidatus Omnitrophota bacterium]
MLDPKFIRENLDLVKTAIKNRGIKLDLGEFSALDKQKKKVQLELEELRRQKNSANDDITKLLKEKKDAKKRIKEMKVVAEKIDGLEAQEKELDVKVKNILFNIPNVPHESIPVGDASNNKVVRSWGKAREFDFAAKNHVEICERLDIMDLPRAAKITGSNFVLFKGDGAKLQRALIDFMLDLHTAKHGYREIWPPALVNRQSMTGTGQLPKLEEDMYKLKDEDLFLVPTAEVPVTNIHRDDVLEEDSLPIYYTAYTPCFRREAGSYGKDTKGLMRVHQFDKVELVKFVKPQGSFDELEKLVADAEEVLQLLNLPYRVNMLSTGDLSFAASKCYDLEAYAPGLDKWLEVSSCSNFCDFQARRANIRYRGKDKKLNYVHTLNGSGVALARTVIAIIENYQNSDGTVEIPQVLRRYFDGKTRIG